MVLNFIMCSINFSAKGWTAALSCGNTRFFRFGLIFIGTLSDSSNSCSYQGCVDHAVKTRIPVAWYQHIFLMTFVSRLNGEIIYMKWWLQFIKKHQLQKLLVLVSRGHIFQLVCWSNWQISQFLVYQRCHIQALCIFGFNCHSVASWNFLEF